MQVKYRICAEWTVTQKINIILTKLLQLRIPSLL